MITVTQADALIRDNILPAPAVTRSLSEAQGGILREPIYADRDLPPYDRIMMDGVALRHAAWQQGRRAFRIEGTLPAGRPAMALKDPEGCLLVMTGAVLPPGCDTVIPVEQLDATDTTATLHPDCRPEPGQFIHRQGSDVRQGVQLLPSGIPLRSPQIALIASVGRATLAVGKPPSLALLSTGDELVDVGQPPAAHQIRPSNAYAYQAALHRSGFPCSERFQVGDDRTALVHALREALTAFDGLVLSGGVSMGAYDFVPLALAESGVRMLFHKVRQKPGKPLWVGLGPKHQPVFALPGNPVAGLICFHRYVLPALERMLGRTATDTEELTLQEDVPGDPALTRFIPVREARLAGGRREALPVYPQNSGDLAALANTDGFIELPEGTAVCRVARLYRWR